MSPYADHDLESPGVGFAVLLRQQRLAVGLTQEELASRSGLGVRTVRELERGRVVRPQRGTVSLLADALELAGDAREAFVQAAATRRPPPARPVAPLPAIPELIGRDRELTEISALLDTADLVTLVGLAGVGKTCLALAVAHRYAGEAAAVSVSSVAGRSDILAAVAAVFGVHRAEELARHEALLVVDGLDRSPSAALPAIQWLRANAPGIKLLATSLGGAGETASGVEWRVEPLDVPPAGAQLDLAELREYPAVALFLARLRQVRPEPVRPVEVPALAELVRRLCGLPLAIELAAARGRILDVPELLDRYGNRVLDLGVGVPVPWRIRDAVAASYRLLAPDEQYVLRRLSVFHGRWSLELAEALLGDRPDTDVEAVLDRLVGLGLVSARAPGELRFRLLDVVCDFAAEQAANTGDLRAARARHAEVIARAVTRVAAELTGPNLLAAVSRLDRLNADIRAALRFAAARHPHTALRICAAIPRWCRFRGREREAHELLRRLLDDPRTADADPQLRAAGQLGAGLLATARGLAVTELTATEAALSTFVNRGDLAGELATRSQLCRMWQAVGGVERARRHAEAIMAAALRTDRIRAIAVAQYHLAWHDVCVGELAVAARRLAGASQRATEVGDARTRALVDAEIAEVARLDGRHDEAIELGRRTLAAIVELGDPGHRVRVLGTIGRAMAESGQFKDLDGVLDELSTAGHSAPGLQALITGYVALGNSDREGAAAAFVEAGHELAGRDDARDVLEALVGAAASSAGAARDDLLGQVDGLCERTGMRLLPRDRALLDR
jgi:predicted ATPase/DNA-binding XRE family transcriptional regulator